MNRILLASLAAVVLAIAPATAAAESVDHGSCLNVDATAIGQNLGHGRTTSTVVHAGILNGTTQGQLEITGGHPPVVTVAGVGVLTAKHGTLTLDVAGTLNQATGAFEFTGQVVDGTGVFAHATGTLTFSGVQDLTSGTFVNNITGTVCLAHD
jgi:hypothetical protein